MFLSSREETLSFDSSFEHNLARESWTMYSLGMLFICLRTFARVRRNGFKGLSPDDYLMWIAACWYTILIVCLNVIASGGGSNLYPPDQYDTFTAEDIKERIKGSKIVVLSEQSMLNTIYTLKTCMLFIYTRLTVQLKCQTYVRILAVYVACGYVGTQLAFFLSCRPFVAYWSMPPLNPQCTTLQHYAITQACFNISSDAFMLAISIPLFITTSLPLKQKVVLVGIFGMGLFVIIAAVLTKVFNLSDLYSTVYMLWYVRESSVAVWVTNLPLIWPLLRETFPMLRSVTPGMRASLGSRTRSKSFFGHGPPILSGIGVKTSTHVSIVDRGVPLDDMRKKRGKSSISLELDRVEREVHGGYHGGKGGISTETTVEVEEHSARHVEEGPRDESHINGWSIDSDDHGYEVHIQGPGREDSMESEALAGKQNAGIVR